MKKMSMFLSILAGCLFFISSGLLAQQVLVTDDGTVETPNSFMQIHKAAATDADLLQLTSGATGSSAANGFKFRLNADKSLIFNNQENAGLSFFTNNTARLAVQNDGIVVVGGAGAASTGTGNLMQIIGGSSVPSSLGTSSFFEIDALNATANTFNFRLSESAGTGYPAFSFAKSRGTLASPSNLAVNDSLGSYTFSGYVGGNWKPLARIAACYPGTGSNQAGTILFQTANNGAPTTKMSISPTGVVNVSGDITYTLVQGSMYLENGSYTPTMPVKNTFYKLSPSMIVSSSVGVTLVPDSITIITSGYYKVDFVIDMQGSNGNDFRVKMFKNHSPTGVAGSATITTLGAGNRVCLSYFYYLNVTVGDVLSFWVTNTSNNTNACTINDMKVYIEKKPQQ